MPLRQKIICILIAATIFIVIIELVRRRKLREEYSWIWFLTGVIVILLTLIPALLSIISKFFGAGMPVLTLFFFAIIFLMMLCLQFSVEISNLANQIKNLTQELTILKAEIDQDQEGTS